MLYNVITFKEDVISMLEIRNANLNDAERILEIYGYYVENTAITFEYTTPHGRGIPRANGKRNETVSVFGCNRKRRNKGYAYAHAFVGRAAYDWSCETTIYVDKGARKQGLGKILYEALENALLKMGIVNMYACIGYPDENDEYLTKNSAEFHKHLGFTVAGRFNKCGYKFGRWYNMIWMEKIIGEHKSIPNPVTKFTK